MIVGWITKQFHLHRGQSVFRELTVYTTQERRENDSKHGQVKECYYIHFEDESRWQSGR